MSSNVDNNIDPHPDSDGFNPRASAPSPPDPAPQRNGVLPSESTLDSSATEKDVAQLVGGPKPDAAASHRDPLAADTVAARLGAVAVAASMGGVLPHFKDQVHPVGPPQENSNGLAMANQVRAAPPLPTNTSTSSRRRSSPDDRSGGEPAYKNFLLGRLGNPDDRRGSGPDYKDQARGNNKSNDSAAESVVPEIPPPGFVQVDSDAQRRSIPTGDAATGVETICANVVVEEPIVEAFPMTPRPNRKRTAVIVVLAVLAATAVGTVAGVCGTGEYCSRQEGQDAPINQGLLNEPTKAPTISPTQAPAIKVLLQECEGDCDKDEDCIDSLICADAHKPELRASGFDRRKANCTNDFMNRPNLEVCFDPSLIENATLPTNIPSDTPSDSPSESPT